MTQLNIAENIVRFRREKKITQEQLAEFVGVTKASVSKWETKQSSPDIMLLPQLATFFDVTVDELLGYDPQLSKEQIQRLYHEIATDFANHPFDTVMGKIRRLIKEYHNCYPFLLEICILWLNHFMLAETPQKQKETLEAIAKLCQRIISDCKELGICSDAMILMSIADLQLGHTKEVIETLEDVIRPDRLATQSDTILIDAYVLSGDAKKADGYTQISMYNHLLALINTSTKFLTIHSDNLPICEETIHRIKTLIETYHLENLNPNAAGVFYYQASIIYIMHNDKKKALENLKACILSMMVLVSTGNPKLHGDDYFNSIEAQFAQLGIDERAPRDRKLIVEDIRNLLNNPVFSVLAEEPEYHRLKNKLMEVK